MKQEAYVFDTYALLALLEDEPGATTVASILTAEQGTKIYLSVISLGEAYYILLRRQGKAAAESFTQYVLAEERISIADAGWERVKQAARIKAGGGLSYADSFVLALAAELGASVVTGDPEIRTIAPDLAVTITWIGSNS